MVLPFLKGGSFFVQVVVGVVHANHIFSRTVIQNSFRDVLIDADRVMYFGSAGAEQSVDTLRRVPNQFLLATLVHRAQERSVRTSFIAQGVEAVS